MKTELRVAPHTQIAGAYVIELWYAGELIGEIAGRDGPGVRIVSKYELAIQPPVTTVSPTVSTGVIHLIDIVCVPRSANAKP